MTDYKEKISRAEQQLNEKIEISTDLCGNLIFRIKDFEAKVSMESIRNFIHNYNDLTKLGLQIDYEQIILNKMIDLYNEK